MKIEKKAATVLYPVPTVLVSCVDEQGKPNMITLAWVGTVCSEPPMLSISVRPSRYSHKLISATGDFVVNIPSLDWLKQTDYCGVVSGANVDKFEATGFTAIPASKVKSPLVKECPVNIECVVRQTLQLGAHDLFIGEIVATHFDEEVLDKKGRLDVRKVKPFVYNGAGEYWSVDSDVGFYGFSKAK
ncbi:MAG: flavin reductase family protein [Candidatus Saccharibacteria bacterium]